MSDTKKEALSEVLADRDPFCRGVCSVPEHQLSLYYARGTGFNRINFVCATTDELAVLYNTCQPAWFDFNKNDACRTARKMNYDTFCSSFDPRSLGIHDLIKRDLLATDQTVELELSKVNVYGRGGPFKAQHGNPRGVNIFGTLVVVLPNFHEGGQLSLRFNGRQWTVDFAKQFATATEPSVCFAAFFRDVEHQIMPVTSGYCVTLTYNLCFRVDNVCRVSSGPFHGRVRQALVELINDPQTLPEGGCLGVGLHHQYSYDETKPIDSLFDQLKGSDAELARVCRELGLPCSLRLLYAQDNDIWPQFFLLSRMKLDGTCGGNGYGEDDLHELLHYAVRHLTPGDLKGVDILGREKSEGQRICAGEVKDEDYEFMKKFYKDPVPQVLMVREASSVLCETSYGFSKGDEETSLEKFHGAASMMISVKPKKLREQLALENCAA